MRRKNAYPNKYIVFYNILLVKILCEDENFLTTWVQFQCMVQFLQVDKTNF